MKKVTTMILSALMVMLAMSVRADDMTVSGQVLMGIEGIPAPGIPVMVFLPSDSIMVDAITNEAGLFEVVLQTESGYQGDVVAQVFDWCEHSTIEEVFPFVNGGNQNILFNICAEGGNGGGGMGCHAAFQWEMIQDLDVAFYDMSMGDDIDDWTWDFGDGTTGNEQEPTHTYTEAGMYMVTLTISGEECQDAITKHVHVMDSIPPQPDCQAMFGYENQDELTIAFFDMSYGDDISDWAWSFGDELTSTEQNPVHTYAEQGMYMVTLTISGADCSSTMEMPVHVMDSIWPPNGGNCHANFHKENIGDLTIAFTDASQGDDIEQWAWNFGDGTTSDEQNPTHTFAEEGMYEVSLSIFSENCEDITVKNVHVCGNTPPQGCQAMFFYENTDLLTITFVDMSMGDITGWAWNFGDENISTEQNPVHTYAVDGMYMVSLEISGDSCNSIIEMPVFVGDSVWPPFGGDCHANFHWDAMDDLMVQFTDASQAEEITEWMWDFGNGDVSSEQNPTYVFAEEGVYEVSLTISGEDCQDTKIKHVHVFDNNWNPQNCHAMFVPEYVSDLTIAFHDMSMGDVESWSWTFGDGASSEDQNPVHTYAAAGEYLVTLFIMGEECADSLAMEILVDEPWNNNPCEALFVPEFTDTPLEVVFHDMSIGDVTSWSWNLGDGTASYDQNPTHIYAEMGTYLVTLGIETSEGCSQVYSIELNLETMSYSALHSSTTTGIQDIENITSVNIFPNPVGETMNIAFNSDSNQSIILNVMNAMGQMVYAESYSVSASQNQITVNTARLEKGIYFLQMKSDNGSVTTHKFIK